MSNVSLHYQINRFVCIYAPTVVLYEILLYNSTITICTISISWMMILLNSSILFFSNGINTNIQLDLRNFKFTIISLESIVNYFVNGFRMNSVIRWCRFLLKCRLFMDLSYETVCRWRKTLQSGLESVKESDGIKFVRPVIVLNK